MAQKQAIIIGAGPAGLTAALELARRSDIKPIVLESTEDLGGISKTVNYKGNRMDIGGHRFFSKSKRVTDWWTELFPLQGHPSLDEILLKMDSTEKYRESSQGPDPEKTDIIMLLRGRLSRIYSFKKFFDYPISLNMNTMLNLGFFRLIRIGFSYIMTRLFPIRQEHSLEDFFVNRFGRELYNTFFRDYTEKVWGVTCREIKPEWGAQRVKGLSITAAIYHALRKNFSRKRTLKGEKVETSLIEQFMYPKLGPGQLWQEAGRQVEEAGGVILRNHRVTVIHTENGKILSIETRSPEGTVETFSGDYFISSMPVKDFVKAINTPEMPSEVREVAEGLVYRDFITVGLLVKEMTIKNHTSRQTINNIVPDNWIYIQESSVKLGRLQIFNNWSPYMVADINTVWIGLEYFCDEGDSLWTMADPDFISMATKELESIGIINSKDVLDGVVIRIQKAYPAYFGSYDNFEILRSFLDRYSNLYPIGRNGMHRYNNMDHSMLTAMVTVDNIISGIEIKDNIWSINTEEDYHEGQ